MYVLLWVILAVLDGERLPPMLSEERLSVGLHAGSVSQMTLAKLRKIYNKADSKILAKQV